ncbi:MAG TPA: hypothetical protein VFD36_00580, partial [Kofleriaceae bacterium]|nr:hypothetical protein [Kofleriaceae bacterium]
VSGRARARIDDKEHDLGPGDFAAFPTPQAAHVLTNPFDEDCVYLMGGEPRQPRILEPRARIEALHQRDLGAVDVGGSQDDSGLVWHAAGIAGGISPVLHALAAGLGCRHRAICVTLAVPRRYPDNLLTRAGAMRLAGGVAVGE